jgi:ring-1,2-phenylacetyl-CoA epoxidase subunit PaaE
MQSGARQSGYGTNYSLEPDELAAGYVLSCQALPLTADVIVDFDAKGMA